MSRTAASKIVYQVVGEGGSQTVYPSVELLTKVYHQIGVVTRTSVRSELQGQPKLQGLAGPMWGGEKGNIITIRYEAPEVYRAMTAAEKHIEWAGKPLILTPKEKARASKDGWTIVTRPQADGGIMVAAFDVKTGMPWGSHVTIVDSKADLPRVIKQETHLLGSMGFGDDMASSSRHRTANFEVNRLLMDALEARKVLLSALQGKQKPTTPQQVYTGIARGNLIFVLNTLEKTLKISDRPQDLLLAHAASDYARDVRARNEAGSEFLKEVSVWQAASKIASSAVPGDEPNVMSVTELKEMAGTDHSKYATEFPTQKALDDYLAKHPKADRSQHHVKKAPVEIKEDATKQKTDYDSWDFAKGTVDKYKEDHKKKEDAKRRDDSDSWDFARSTVNKSKTASDAELRIAVTKLAHDVPELRKHLVTILNKTLSGN